MSSRERGTGRTRHYVHDEVEAERYGSAAGTFTEWEQLDPRRDLLFYEGLHGAAVTRRREPRRATATSRSASSP